ncbi:tyrosine-type recombinase/integrase [Mangrovitalea sediminis]|uniref:tyrosine-type recombinase/integrase n=1 Tax=Mangrovitalea sediminis TaxID=1982043 RepID=UPI000BE5D8D2|nr:site-specific integrase [Mangrovitalea sediminis]
MRNKTTGLYKSESGIWHIDKRVRGIRIRESTGTSEKAEAESYLARKMEETRQASVYGVRPERTWRQAATRYLRDHQHKKSVDRDAQDFKLLDPFIGDLLLRKVHAGTLERFIQARKAEGRKSATVNRSLAVVRRVLTLAARLWRDEHGLTWLEAPPLIPNVEWGDRRAPYPLSWDEQERLFGAVAGHLREAAIFAVNTGCREKEITGLRWDWEISLPELGTSVFLLPGEFTKNGDDRIVPLNSEAKACVNRQRGKHSEYVFSYKGKPMRDGLNNNGWKRARAAVGLTQVRVHDLRHTFGRRLRAAGVPEETRKALMGHRSGSMTTHYSAAEVQELMHAVERLVSRVGGGPTLTLLKL